MQTNDPRRVDSSPSATDKTDGFEFQDEPGVEPQLDESSGLFSLAVGDCLNIQTPNAPNDRLSVDCELEHDAEVYAALVAEGDSFPGEEIIQATAYDSCGSSFESFIGVPYNDSVLSFTYLYPTEETWIAGDRETLCIVSNPSRMTLGSLRGSAT